MNIPLVQTLVYDQAALANVLLAGPAAGCLDGAKLHLYSADFTPDYLTELADLPPECAVLWLRCRRDHMGRRRYLGCGSGRIVRDRPHVRLDELHDAAVGLFGRNRRFDGAYLYFVAQLTPNQIAFIQAGDQAIFTVRMNADGSASLECLS